MIRPVKRDNSFLGNMVRDLNTIDQKKCFLLLFVSLASLLLLSSQIQASINGNLSSFEFLDDGRLTLTAEGVPLGTLLREILEETNLELKIHENHLKQPIYVRFQSLPLNEAIKRIMRGISHACLFDSDSNVEKIITFPNAGKSNGHVFHKRFQGMSPTYEKTMRIANPLEVETDLELMPPPPPGVNIVRAIKPEEIVHPPDVDAIEEVIGIVPPPEGEDIEEPIVITPPPELEDLVTGMNAVEIVSPLEE
jgi:hypothetical protein